MTLSTNAIQRIINAKETRKIDFKANLLLGKEYPKIEFAKDVSAIANTPGPRGLLIFGIDNDGKVIGISKSDFKETQMQQIIASKCDPPVIFSAYTIKYLGKTLGIVEIPPSINRPHQVIQDGVFWIRRGTTSGFMSTQELLISIMRRRQGEKSKSSEYDHYSQNQRFEVVYEDTISAFIEYGFTVEREKWTKEKKEKKTCVLVNRKTHQRFYVDFSIGTMVEDAVFRFMRATIDWFNRPNRYAWINVFALVAWSTIPKKVGGDWPYNSEPNVRVQIESSTYYHGIGKTKLSNTRDEFLPGSEYSTPKFFLSHVRSKEDIQTRIGLIVEYIYENRQVFKDAIKLRKLYLNWRHRNLGRT